MRWADAGPVNVSVASTSTCPPCVVAVTVVLGTVALRPVAPLVLQQMMTGAENGVVLIEFWANKSVEPLAPWGPCGPVAPSHTYCVCWNASVTAAPPFGHVMAGAAATVTLLPLAPAGPCGPGAPFGPESPFGPCEPCGPEAPAGPVAPGAPVSPFATRSVHDGSAPGVPVVCPVARYALPLKTTTS